MSYPNQAIIACGAPRVRGIRTRYKQTALGRCQRTVLRFAALSLVAVASNGCAWIGSWSIWNVPPEEPLPFVFGEEYSYSEANTYTAMGPYGIGTLETNIESTDRPLAVTVWYPTKASFDTGTHAYFTPSPEEVAGELAITGIAESGAQPATASPFPLVIFSHGNESYRQYSSYLMEHLVSHGFVVMAPNHIGDTLADTREGDAIVEGKEPDYFVYRPRDIHRVLDHAEMEQSGAGILAGVMDLDRVAVIGHSFGGFTALVAGGAMLNTAEYATLFCEDPEYRQASPGTCDEFEAGAVAERVAAIAGLEAIPAGNWPSLADSRVDAVVALAPGFTPFFGRSGLQSVTVPVLSVVGSADAFALDFHTAFVHENIPATEKTHVTLCGAGHNVFSNSCDRVPWEDESICGTDGWDSTVQAAISQYVTAFLRKELYGEQGASSALEEQPDGIKVWQQGNPPNEGIDDALACSDDCKKNDWVCQNSCAAHIEGEANKNIWTALAECGERNACSRISEVECLAESCPGELDDGLCIAW